MPVPILRGLGEFDSLRRSVLTGGVAGGFGMSRSFVSWLLGGFGMRNFVVSANYHDRKSENRWYVRPVSATERKEYRSVLCKNVRFEESSSYELGFGCLVVAMAEEVETFEGNPRPLLQPEQGKLVKLRFVYDHFCVEELAKLVEGQFQAENGPLPNGHVVTCKELWLMPNGSIYAVI